VIVGHGNVIRYFVCRALQLPPEAWLRMSIFNGSITYIMIQPNGYVTIRLLGDTGHLPYEETTFSGSHGWNWS
jgi:serine/threonine-protein phosphatase PGAM5